MPRKAILSSSAPAPPSFLSQAVRQGDLIFCSGQIGVNPETGALVKGGVKERITQVLKNLAAVLSEAGSSFAFVTKCNIFLTETEDFAVVNEVYHAAFEDPKPARTCVFVKALPQSTDVEIELVAAVDPEKAKL